MKRHNHQTAFSHSIIRLFDYSIISQRRGSALLIVLGMLSFMVISAVAFSVMMRQNRLPSSYLRRNIASRYLVRAALARAIEELEGDFNDNRDWGKYTLGETDLQPRFYGIYDDPYPGCGTDAKRDERENGDLWFRRVFMPFGPTKYAECTVPTLTLEALAYLPPAIIDDVRKFSRYTRTAAWRTLPYEAGRYAYTAVNVSDLFDINRLCADEPRDTRGERVSMMALCGTKDDPTAFNAGAASELHELVRAWEKGGSDTPFVSLADFNLSSGRTDYSPFMSFVGEEARNVLQQGNNKTANSLFITDTWFPPASVEPSTTSGGSGAKGQNGQNQTASSGSSVTYDLAGSHQPFLRFNASDFESVKDCLNPQDNVNNILMSNLGLGLAGLYDYLDGDSVPVSLGLPTVEAVPMVAGVSCPAMLKPEFDEGQDSSQRVIKLPNPNFDEKNPMAHPKEITITRKWRRLDIRGFGRNVLVKPLLTFPFKRMKTTQRLTGAQFKVRGLLRVFAAPANLGCRPDDGDHNLTSYVDSWNAGVVPKFGVATFLSDAKDLSSSKLLTTDVKTTDEAIEDSNAFALKFDCTCAQPMPVMYIVDETCDSAVDDAKALGFQGNKTYHSLDGLKGRDVTFRPLTLAGDVDPAWNALQAKPAHEFDTDNLNVVTDSLESFGGNKYKLYAAVWVQVLDGNQVVDMVPAVLQDDVDWLGAPAALSKLTPFRNKVGGGGTPLLHFCGDKDVVFTEEIKQLEAVVTFPDWKTLYVVDPRFNFAPEDWFMQNSSTEVTADAWKQALNNVFGKTVGGVERDRDLFMFVSDREYLQDIGELQFLPRLQEMTGRCGAYPLQGDYAPDFSGRRFTERTAATGTAFANSAFFWRTYTAYNNDNRDRRQYNGNGDRPWDPIYALPDPNAVDTRGIRFHSGVGGFKLNPYSDDARVLGGALVGTPFDYYVAFPEEVTLPSGGKGRNDLGAANLLNYTFGTKSDLARMSADDLADIAAAFRGQFLYHAEKYPTYDWSYAYDNEDVDSYNRCNDEDSIEWQEQGDSCVGDSNKSFMNVNALADPLHQVDRKFLYSYWRECFDNRQQLFLIFVRAEPPNASAGTVGRNLPSSQLGGNAVALVWRDPAVPTYSNGATRKTREQMRTSRNDVMDNREKCAPHRTRILFYHQFD